MNAAAIITAVEKGRGQMIMNGCSKAAMRGLIINKAVRRGSLN